MRKRLHPATPRKVVEFDSFKLETEDIEDFFKIFNKIDFNDYLFMKYAKCKGLIFVTNDKDFSIRFDKRHCALNVFMRMK